MHVDTNCGRGVDLYHFFPTHAGVSPLVFGPASSIDGPRELHFSQHLLPRGSNYLNGQVRILIKGGYYFIQHRQSCRYYLMCGYYSRKYGISVPPSLQIAHIRGNHWIVVTTLGSPVGSPKVFDSLYETIDQSTLEYFSSLYGSPIKVENGPKQQGSNDCGIFAIATATSDVQVCHQLS